MAELNNWQYLLKSKTAIIYCSYIPTKWKIIKNLYSIKYKTIYAFLKIVKEITIMIK